MAGDRHSWLVEEIDSVLAADLNTNLSGLGIGSESSAYNMSEAISALQCIKTEDLQIAVQRFPENSQTISGKMISETSKSDLAIESAPLVPNVSSAVRPGLTMKESEEKRIIQCVLGAPTALGIKVGEETLTYLNQGQSYEVRIRKVGNPPELKGKMLKSFIMVRFQERRLHHREKEEIDAWKINRPGERILDVDLPLSYGIFDVNIDPAEINACDFVWDSTREVSVFIKVNCISTEFTSRRRGGEKGIILCLTVDTWTHGEYKCDQVDVTFCQLKVFKSKGADRKHRTDRERMEKRPPEDLTKYQPSYQCTVLTECPSDIVLRFPASSLTQTECPSSTCMELSLSKYSPGQIPKSSSSYSLSSFHEEPESQPKETRTLPSYTDLSYYASAEEMAQWLKTNRFEKYQCTFSNFTASDIVQLNRDDLIQICGVADGIRLYNTLHSRTIPPKLTIYVASSDDQAFYAIYLETFSVQDLEQKLKDVFRLQKETVNGIYMTGPSGIYFYVTDKVVQNMSNDSIYYCDTIKDHSSTGYDIYLKPQQ
ncbi:transcription factor CP2-like isoform X2 [Tachypleus tridentatus]|uniref:transcription factor CP2-like isoform X2 n=1 Tax=Tachypleus tridentatus TaxID=6853 RepID=UPI003FD2C27A